MVAIVAYQSDLSRRSRQYKISIGSVGTGGITAASIADAAIDNATFAADVGSTVYASNIIALAVNKALANYDPPTKDEMDTAHALLATPAQVNAQVLDVMATDTISLPGQGAPSVTPTIVTALGYLYKNWRNKKTQTATEFKLFADDGTTADQKATVSDDATTATKGEMGTGA